MTTTAKRLRIAARHDESQGRMMNEAADLIEQQQREIRKLESVNTDAVKALTERNTLVAHNELLTNGIGYAIEALNTEVANLGTIRSEEIKELQAIKKIAPQTSLAERDADIAESAIKTALRNLGEPNLTETSIAGFANDYANKIRNGKDGDQ